MPRKTRASSKNTAKSQDKDQESDTRSRSCSNFSEQDDRSSFMDIEDSRGFSNSEIPLEEVKLRASEEDPDEPLLPEFRFNLPTQLESFESFVWIIAPVIEQIEEYIRSNGETVPNFVNARKPDDIEPETKFQPRKAVHFYGAILQSFLHFSQKDRTLIFSFDDKINQEKEQSLSERIIQPILARLKKKPKGPTDIDLLTQQLMLVLNEDYSPLIEHNDEDIVNELTEIIKEYELTLLSLGEEHRANYFHKMQNRGEMPRATKPKKFTKRKAKGESQPSMEDDKGQAAKQKAQMLFSEIGGVNPKDKRSKNALKQLGGDIQTLVCPASDLEKEAEPLEVELRQVLISAYNNKSTSEEFFSCLGPLIQGRQRLPDVSLYTTILLSVVYYLQAKSLQTLSLDDLMDYINISRVIPFPTTSCLQILNNRLFIAEGIDTILSTELENCMPRSAYFPAIEEFNEDTNHMNLVSAGVCPSFAKLYARDSCRIVTPTVSKLGLYSRQLEVLNKLCRFLFDSQTNDKENVSPKKRPAKTIQQFEALVSDVKGVPELSDFAECEHLDNMYAKALASELTVEKAGKETEEWVSPQFGRGADEDSMSEGPRRENLDIVVKELVLTEENKEPLEVEKGPSERTPNKSDYGADEHNQAYEHDYSYADVGAADDQDWPEQNANFEAEGEKHHDDDFLGYDEPSFTNVLNTIKEERKTEVQEEEPEMEIETVKHKSPPKEIEEEHPAPITPQEEPKIVEKPSKKTKEVKETKESNEESPPRRSRKVNEIEKDHTKQIKILMSKPTLTDIEQNLIGLETMVSPVLFKKKKATLEAQVEKAKTWLASYQKQVEIGNRGVKEVKTLIEQIFDNELRVPEMEQLLEKQREYKLWRVRLDSALKKYKKRKRNAVAAMDIEPDSAASKRKQPEILTVDELEELIAQADSMQIEKEEEEPRFAELRQKWLEIQPLKEKLDSAENDLSTLRKLEKEINAVTIVFPTLGQLREKIVVNEKIVNALESYINVEELANFVNTIEESMALLDPVLYSQLYRKNEEGQKFQGSVITLISSAAEYEYNDVCDIQAVISDIQSLKVIVHGQEQLMDVLSSFAWLLKFDKLVRRVQGMLMENETAVEMNENSCMSAQQFEEKFETEELIEFCKEWLKNVYDCETGGAELQDELRGLAEEGEPIKMADHRIETLYKELNSEVWANEGKSFLTKERTTKDLERFMQAPSRAREQIDSQTLFGLEKDAEKVKSWRELYNEVMALGLEDLFQNSIEAYLKDPVGKENVLTLKWKLTKLVSEYQLDLERYPDLAKCIGPLQKYLSWSIWLLNADTLIAELSVQDNNRLAQLQTTYQEAVKIGIPKNWALYKSIEELFTMADSLLAEYKQKFQYINPYDKWSGTKSPMKESVHKLLEKRKVRPLVSEAVMLYDALNNNLSYIDCTEQIALLGKKLDEYSKWRAKLESYASSEGQRVLQAALQTGEILPDHAKIERQLAHLKSEFITLDLRDEIDERQLAGFECQFRTYLLMKNISPNATVDEWKKLLKYAEEDPAVDPTDDKSLLKFLHTEMENGKAIHKVVKSLQTKNERSGEINTLEDLQSILFKLKKGMMKLPNDEKFMEEMIQKVEKMAARGHELCNGEKKEPIMEFTKTLDQMKHLPVSLKDEEKRLEELILSANKIASYIRKNPIMDLAVVQKTLEEYNNCPVIISEAQKLQEKYDRSHKLHQEIKVALDDILKGSTELNYESLKEMSSQVDEVKYDFEGDLNLIKAQIYSLRVQVLQKHAGIQEPNSDGDKQEFLINTQVVSSLTREGKLLKKSLEEQGKTSQSLNQAIFWMENLTRKVDDKLKEIAKVMNADTLTRMPKVMLGFVDFSQNYIERKAALIAVFTPQIQVQKNNDALPIAQQGDKKKQEIGRPLMKREEFSKIKEALSKPMNERKEHQAEIKKRKAAELAAEEEETTRKFQNKLASQAPVKRAEKSNPEKNLAMMTIRDILQSNSNLSLDLIESLNIANQIVEGFPRLQESKEKLASFAKLLKVVLKYPGLCQMLAGKGFPIKDLSVLFKKTPEELQSINLRYVDFVKDKKKGEKVAAPVNAIHDGQAIKKKVKKEGSTNAYSDLLNPISQLQASMLKGSRSSNLLKGSDIESSLLNEASQATIESSTRLSGLFSKKSNVPRSMNAPQSVNEEEIQFSKFKPKEADDNFSDYGQGDMAAEGFEEDFGPIGYDTDDNTPLEDGFVMSSEGHIVPVVNLASLSKKARGPLLFDPENPSDEISRVSSVGNSRQEVFVKIPKDSVFKVFDGMLKEKGDKTAPRVGFFTCDPCEAIRKMPRIMGEAYNVVTIEGTLQSTVFEPYFNKSMNTFDMSKAVLISGWVESHQPMYQSVCEEKAKQLLINSRIGMTKYTDDAKIFFLHYEQLRPEWITRLKFTKRKLQKESYSSLCFILMHQFTKTTRHSSRLSRIEPEVIAPYREERPAQNIRGRAQAKPIRVESSGNTTPELDINSRNTSQNVSRNSLSPRQESQYNEQASSEGLTALSGVSIEQLRSKGLRIEHISPVTPEDLEKKSAVSRALCHEMELEANDPPRKNFERFLNNQYSDYGASPIGSMVSESMLSEQVDTGYNAKKKEEGMRKSRRDMKSRQAYAIQQPDFQSVSPDPSYIDASHEHETFSNYDFPNSQQPQPQPQQAPKPRKSVSQNITPIASPRKTLLQAQKTPLNTIQPAFNEDSAENARQSLCCEVTKCSIFDNSQPTLGYPLNIEQNKNGSYSATPIIELISYDAHTMRIMSDPGRSNNWEETIVYSATGEPYNFWIPIYVNEEHWSHGFEQIITAIVVSQKGLNGLEENDFQPEMILEVLPTILNKLVVQMVQGPVQKSSAVVQAYTHFYRLFIRLLAEFPELQDKIDRDVGAALRKLANRNKTNMPDIGKFLVKVSLSRYNAKDVKIQEILFQEFLARQVMWVTKADPSLVQRSKHRAFLKSFFKSSKLSCQIFLMAIEAPIVVSKDCPIMKLDDRFGKLPGKLMEGFVKKLAMIRETVCVNGNWETLMKYLGLEGSYQGEEEMVRIVDYAFDISSAQGYTKEFGVSEDSRSQRSNNHSQQMSMVDENTNMSAWSQQSNPIMDAIGISARQMKSNGSGSQSGPIQFKSNGQLSLNIQQARYSQEQQMEEEEYEEEAIPMQMGSQRGQFAVQGRQKPVQQVQQQAFVQKHASVQGNWQQQKSRASKSPSVSPMRVPNQQQQQQAFSKPQRGFNANSQNNKAAQNNYNINSMPLQDNEGLSQSSYCPSPKPYNFQQQAQGNNAQKFNKNSNQNFMSNSNNNIQKQQYQQQQQNRNFNSSYIQQQQQQEDISALPSPNRIPHQQQKRYSDNKPQQNNILANNQQVYKAPPRFNQNQGNVNNFNPKFNNTTTRNLNQSFDNQSTEGSAYTNDTNTQPLTQNQRSNSRNLQQHQQQRVPQQQRQQQQYQQQQQQQVYNKSQNQQNRGNFQRSQQSQQSFYAESTSSYPQDEEEDLQQQYYDESEETNSQQFFQPPKFNNNNSRNKVQNNFRQQQQQQQQPPSFSSLFSNQQSNNSNRQFQSDQQNQGQKRAIGKNSIFNLPRTNLMSGQKNNNKSQEFN